MTPSPALAPDAARWITVVLTAHVDGCLGLPVRDPGRLRHFHAAPPAAVVRAVLTRLGRAPDDVDVAQWGDDPALFGAVDGCDGPRPLACFWAGADAEDLTRAIDGLRAVRWRPAPTPSPNNPFNGASA